MEAAAQPWPALGALLVRDGLVEREELEALLDDQADVRQHGISGWRLGELLVESGTVTQEQVSRLLAEQYELPYVDLDPATVDPVTAARLPDALVDRFTALPLEVLPIGALLVAVADPGTVLFSDELRRTLGMPLRFTVAAPAAMASAIAFVRAHAVESRARTAVARAVTPALLPDREPVPVVERPRPTRPDAPAAADRPPLGALLVREGLVSEDELETALAQQRLSSDKRLGEILVERGAATRSDIARLLAEQYELPYVDVDPSEIEPEVSGLLSHDVAERYLALPLSTRKDGSLLVAVADPTRILDLDELLTSLTTPLAFAVADPDVIESELARRRLGPVELHTDDADPSSEAKMESPDSPPAPEPQPSPAAEGDAAAIGLDSALADALGRGASAIHVSVRPGGLVVRARVDGALERMEVDDDRDRSEIARELTARAGDDASGGLEAVTLPSRYGDVTFRASARFDALPLDDLGLDLADADTLRGVLRRRSGLVLLAGPVGSGRTTTLYGALEALDVLGRAVVTIEDRVAVDVLEIAQIELDPPAGVTAAKALQAALDADPDVLVVDELADESAARAVHAAAGLLVLASARAGTAAAAVELLVAAGCDAPTLADALSAVLAQRLVRRTCVDCRETYYATADELVQLGRPAEEVGRRLLGRGRGCASCDGTGFRGRTAFCESLPLTDEVRALVASGASSADLDDAAHRAGGRSLREDAARLCLDGMTTVDEIRSVLGPGV